jgi:TonB family protein
VALRRRLARSTGLVRALGCGLVLTVGLGAPAVAAADPRISFAIPAQPLVTALEAYSAASGLQVLYDSRLAAGRRSRAVDGMLTPDVALHALLAGTDLIVRYTASHDVIIAAPSAARAADAATPMRDAPVLALDTLHVRAPTDAAAAPARASYRAYGGVIQTAVQGALYRKAETRSGGYKVGMNLWVDASGAVRRAELLGSTGDAKRDAAVLDAVGEIATRRPPPDDLPQPISVQVEVRPR